MLTQCIEFIDLIFFLAKKRGSIYTTRQKNAGFTSAAEHLMQLIDFMKLPCPFMP